MWTYIFRRFLQAIPVILGVAIISFFFSEMSGSPIRAMLGPKVSPEVLQKVTEHYGYDKPAPERFFIYLSNLLHGNLGYSLFNAGLPVTDLIATGMKVTLKLSLGAILFAICLGLPLGILSARYPNSIFDYAASSFAGVAVAVPAFFLAIVLKLVFSVWLGWFPITGYDPGSLKHLVLPCFALGLISTAATARLTRNCLLDTLSQDYVRTGRAKGCAQGRVLLGHALPNALVPVITIIGSDFAGLLCGAILTETVFGLPGVGLLLSSAVTQRDLPMVMGCCIMMSLIFVFANLLVDISYAFLDPRIRYE